MSEQTINEVINAADTVETFYDKADKHWKNRLVSNRDNVLSDFADRTEAVSAGKQVARENKYAYSVLRKDGNSLCKMMIR